MPSMMNKSPKKPVKAASPPLQKSAPPDGVTLPPGTVWNSILGKSMLDPAHTDFVQAFRDTFHPDYAGVSSSSAVYAHSTRHVPPNVPREPSPEPIFGRKAEARREGTRYMQKKSHGGDEKPSETPGDEGTHRSDVAEEKSKILPSSGSAVDVFYDALTRQ